LRIVTPDTLVTSVPSTTSVLTDSQPSLTDADRPKTEHLIHVVEY
jgi:hypothetical protein